MPEQTSAILVGQSVYLIPDWGTSDDGTRDTTMQRIDLQEEEFKSSSIVESFANGEGGSAEPKRPVLFHTTFDFCVDN